MKILSVSIAAYNVEAYIKETLNCFVDVRGADRLDVMVIDDGSKDHTAEIVKEYVEKYPEIFRLIQKENGGWGSTVNTGIANAKGKYFKLLDGDDYFVHEQIAAFLDGLEYADSDLVLTPGYAFASDTKRRMYNINDYFFKTNYRSYPMEKMNMYAFSPSVYGVCFKTERLKQADIHITEHCFYTDVEYVLKGCNCCSTASSLPMEIYCYRKARSGQSMSLEGVRKHYLEHYKMLTTLLAYDKEQVKRKYIHDIFNIRLTDVAANMYKWFLFQEPNAEHKEQLVAFDKLLQEEYPQIYASNASVMVGILRKTKFSLYTMIAKRQLEQDRKKKIDIFAG